MLNTMKLCLALLLLLNAGAAWAGEAADAEALPPAVQSLIDKATQDVAKERAKYDAAAKKLTDKLAADLKKEVEKATKAGNLKMALAVQAQLDEVAKGSVVAKVDGQTKSGDLLGDMRPNTTKASIVGKWNRSAGGYWILEENGKGVHVNGGTTHEIEWGTNDGVNYDMVFINTPKYNRKIKIIKPLKEAVEVVLEGTIQLVFAVEKSQ